MSPLIFDNRRNGTLKPPGDMDILAYYWKSSKRKMAGTEGFEPPTQWLTATCSAS